MRGELFFDTCVLCYAYDSSEPVKRKACQAMVEQAFRGGIRGVVSNQVLVELFNALTRKLGVPDDKARIIVKSLAVSDSWRKIDYTHDTVDRALNSSELLNAPFLDALIAETMKENGVTEIVTEDEKGFARIPGIRIRNPFE